MDKGEDRDVRADANRECEYDAGGEAGVATQCPSGVHEVLL